MAVCAVAHVKGVVAMYLTVTSAAAVPKLREIALAQAAAMRLVHSLWDHEYGRLSLSFYGAIEHGIAARLGSIAQAAADVSKSTASDSHTSLHPRCGLVDHISVQPLQWDATEHQELAATVCTTIANGISNAVGAECLMYGWACPSGESLSGLRRKIGYFDPLAVSPCEHGERVGRCTIGASPPVLNANYTFKTAGNVEQARKWLHRNVGWPCSTRGGGLKGVELATLLHADCDDDGNHTIEVACNLTAVDRGGATPGDVATRLAELFCAAPDNCGVMLGPGWYIIGLRPSEMEARSAKICSAVEEPLLECISQQAASLGDEFGRAPLLQEWPRVA